MEIIKKNTNNTLELISLSANDFLSNKETSNAKSFNQEQKPKDIDSFKTIKTFLLHTKLLLVKNFLIISRNRKQAFMQLFSPLMMLIMVTYFQGIVDDFSNSYIMNPKVKNLNSMPKCFYDDYNPNDCYSVAYSVIGEKEPWIDYVMNYVSAANGYNIQTDIKYLGQGAPNLFTDYLQQNQNKTMIGVIFCTSEWTIQNDVSIPCQFEQGQNGKMHFYSIIYNSTLFLRLTFFQDYSLGLERDPVATKFKLSIDNGIIAYYDQLRQNPLVEPTFNNHNMNPKNDYMNLFIQDYPKTYPRFLQGYDLTSAFGAFYFFVPYMVSFIVTITEMVREKAKRLRQGLTIMGMSPSSYWTSWFITVNTMNLLITLSLLTGGYLLRFDLFVKTPVVVTFGLFYAFGMSMQAVAFLVTTFCSDMKTGYTIGYALLLFAVVIEFFIANPGGVYIFYLTDNPRWFVIIRAILSLYPAFHYSKAYGEVCTGSCRHYDFLENRFVNGQGFVYNDLTKEIGGKFPTGQMYQAPSTEFSFFIIFFDTIIYLLLTWYFDHIISNNRGSSDSAFFFLERKYWRNFICPKRKVYTNIKHHDQKYHASIFHHDTVKSERDKVIQNNEENIECNGLRITNLNKVYHKYPFGIKSKEDLHAVKNIYLEVDDCELLALLGHNGAGKTTLFGVLTGMLEATSGNAQIYNYDIRNNIEEIRQIMGVCPQHDILWDELTAEEHLVIFAKLKELPEDKILEEANTKLKEVGLYDVRKVQAGTFSGGMKRRLSMAICTIGNPKIVFLDEPTTGMDPNSRRQVWELIKKLKQNRVVILTTHAMEEADVLSDRIAVIVDGALQCIGTQLYLKNQFGDGYRLSLITDKHDVPHVLEKIKEILPSSKILDESGGSILLGIPLAKINELNSFFKIIQNREINDYYNDLKSKLKDWGLSHTTLEEVFMRVTHKKLGFNQENLS